jgi:hypothetical protein
MTKLLIGGFLLAHGLIHLSYLSPAPPRTAGGPEWPFEMARSWLVTGVGLEAGAARALGTALALAAAILLAGAALATVGWIVPGAWWPALAVGGAVASLATLVLFFHPWLVLGLAIDALVLWWALLAGGLEASWFGP